jgi:hypothetical protein
MGLDDFGDHIGEPQPQAETAAERIGLRRPDPVSAGEGAYENRAAMDEDAY